MRSVASNAVIGAIMTFLPCHVPAQDDLSFSGNDADGCKIIPLGIAGGVECVSASDEPLTWLHDERPVPEFPSVAKSPVHQMCGRLHFLISATVQDSGDYNCTSDRDEKRLQVYIVNISEKTTLGLQTSDPLEAFTSSATAIATPAGDLSFNGDDGNGCKTIPLGTGGTVGCQSSSNQVLTWWLDGTQVSEYNTAEPIRQINGQLYIYGYATVEDSGDYYCKSQNEEKLLKVWIVDMSDSTIVDLCVTDPSTPTRPTVVIIVPVILVALLVALLVFLYFRRRSLGEEVTSSAGEKKSEIYDTVELESKTGQCNDSYSPPRKSEHPVAPYEFIDDAIAKSGEYHTLKLDTVPMPSDGDGLYNKLSEVTGKPWTANTNENKANKDDPYTEIKDSNVESQEENKDSTVDDDDDCARSDEKSNAAGGPVESETDGRTNNYFEINLPNTEDLYARPNKPQTSTNQ